ncbi:hypothetical protein AAU61_20585 [Desulfocarbo indianensis]|nr:hypothetical protein AAU61_20585 [Desulfocarbo indianensis]
MRRTRRYSPSRTAWTPPSPMAISSMPPCSGAWCRRARPYFWTRPASSPIRISGPFWTRRKRWMNPCWMS